MSNRYRNVVPAFTFTTYTMIESAPLTHSILSPMLFDHKPDNVTTQEGQDTSIACKYHGVAGIYRDKTPV